MSDTDALVLTGGGARSAYQAGALQAITKVLAGPQRCPFGVLTGTSSGALNAAYLASRVDSFTQAVESLAALWSGLDTRQIYRTDAGTLSRIGLHWLAERTLGGIARRRRAVALLDTTPLRRFIENHTDLSAVAWSIRAGRLRGLAVNAVDYCCGINRTFFQGASNAEPWLRSRRRGESAMLTVDHLLASTAIPVLFPPVAIAGHYYGDGAVRNYAPLSSAIKFGASRLLVIAVRRAASPPLAAGEDPSLGRIVSVLLNSVLLDGIDLDLERLEAINESLSERGQSAPDSERALRRVEALVLRPSEDIGRIAQEETQHLPATMRYLLRGLGTPRESADLASYLLFESSYTERLRRLGYKDTLARADEIRTFLADAEGSRAC